MDISLSTAPYVKRNCVLVVVGIVLFGIGLYYSIGDQSQSGIWIFSIGLLMGLYHGFDAIYSRGAIFLGEDKLMVQLRNKVRSYRYSDISSIEDHPFNGFIIHFKDNGKFYLNTKFEVIESNQDLEALLENTKGLGKFKSVNFVKGFLQERIDRNS